jgi:hypothetical protein
MPEAPDSTRSAAAELRTASTDLRRQAHEQLEARRWRTKGQLVEQRIVREHRAALRHLGLNDRSVEP